MSFRPAVGPCILTVYSARIQSVNSIVCLDVALDARICSFSQLSMGAWMSASTHPCGSGWDIHQAGVLLRLGFMEGG